MEEKYKLSDRCHSSASKKAESFKVKTGKELI